MFEFLVEPVEQRLEGFELYEAAPLAECGFGHPGPALGKELAEALLKTLGLHGEQGLDRVAEGELVPAREINARMPDEPFRILLHPVQQ